LTFAKFLPKPAIWGLATFREPSTIQTRISIVAFLDLKCIIKEKMDYDLQLFGESSALQIATLEVDVD
jgi:hypothetical protein